MLRGLKTAPWALALAFVLGLGLGAWAMRLTFDRTLRRWDPQQRLVAQLDARLSLNETQKKSVTLILESQKMRMETLRVGWESDVRMIGRAGEDAIALVLSPDQAARFSADHDKIHGSVERYLWSSQDAASAVAGEDPARDTLPGSPASNR